MARRGMCSKYRKGEGKHKAEEKNIGHHHYKGKKCTDHKRAPQKR